MKRIIAIIMIAAVIAALLCACGAEQLTVDAKYAGTYSFTKSTMSETAVRTLTLNADGTYLFKRESNVEGRSGEYTGTWGKNSSDEIILTGDESGKTSKATMRADGKSLNISDIGRVYDTVADGIYFLVDETE